MLYEHPDIYNTIHDGFVEDILFYQDLAFQAGGPVCELACGNGRVTIPLARAGVPITGIDLSQAMIAAARAAVGTESSPPNPLFLVGDMRDPPLPDPAHGYALFFIALHSLSHLEETEDVLRCLRSVRRALVPGGRLALAVHNPDPPTLARDPDALFPVTMPGETAPDSAVTILESTRYDRTRQVLHVRWWMEECMEEPDAARSGATGPSHTLFPDPDPVPIDFTLRMFFPCEMELLLDRAGFVMEERYGWYDRSPFTSESGTQLIVARAKSAR